MTKIRFLREDGLVSKIGSFELRVISNKDLAACIGTVHSFGFARKFALESGIWFSCPLADGNLMKEFVNSILRREKKFRDIRVGVGSVSNSKFLLVEKAGKSELYVSNEETRDYILGLQDLNLRSIDEFSLVL